LVGFEKQFWILVFKNTFFPQNMPLDTWNSVSTPLLIFFAKNAKSFRANSEKVCGENYFSLKKFSPKFLLGHVDMCFDNHAKFSSTKVREISVEAA